jgi:DNA ligase-1
MKMKQIINLSILTSLLSTPLFCSKPQLLLLNTYKDQNTTNWVMSEKLDGIRGFWDGKQLLSRSGKVIHAPKWFIKDYPTFEIDGELWTKRDDFDTISSIVRDKIPSNEWKNIKHYIFEVPNAKGNLFQRLAKVKPFENEYIKILPQISIQNKAHQENYLKEIEAKKGEGIVVRDPNTLYINKRTSSALKVKNFKDSECKILGYTNGNGKYFGKVGAIICQLSNKKEFKIGSGMNDNFRKNPPKLGTEITFKYQNITKNGKPRFPVYLRIREQ